MRGAIEGLPTVDDGAEQLGGFFRIVASAVGLLIVPFNPSGFYGLGEDRLAEDQAAQGGSIKGTEGMERIALDPAAFCSCVDEA